LAGCSILWFLPYGSETKSAHFSITIGAWLNSRLTR